MKKAEWPLMVLVSGVDVHPPTDRVWALKANDVLAGLLRDWFDHGRRHPDAGRLHHLVRVWLDPFASGRVASWPFSPGTIRSLSAVGGLAVAQPSVIDRVVPISLGFLAFIFLIQRFGAHRIAIAYSPLFAVWMLLIGVTGAYNISTHPAVMRACDPSRAVMYFVRTGNYDAMAGVILALTGAEGA
jgi:hypothetical protein